MRIGSRGVAPSAQPCPNEPKASVVISILQLLLATFVVATCYADWKPGGAPSAYPCPKRFGSPDPRRPPQRTPKPHPGTPQGAQGHFQGRKRTPKGIQKANYELSERKGTRGQFYDTYMNVKYVSFGKRCAAILAKRRQAFVQGRSPCAVRVQGVRARPTYTIFSCIQGGFCRQRHGHRNTDSKIGPNG
jgi:hypothetical protein